MNYGNLLSHDYGVASGKWLSTKTLDVALRSVAIGFTKIPLKHGSHLKEEGYLEDHTN